MKAFCIPVVLAEKLKAAAQKGEIDIEEMATMSSKQRRELFEKYSDKEVAKEINLGFEKAISSENQKALAKWAKETFTGSEAQKKRLPDVYKKIKDLTDSGILTPNAENAFYEDLVAEKLGLNITEEQAKTISDHSKNLQNLESKLTFIGDPTDNRASQVEYFVEKRKVENYLDSLNPSSKLAIATSTIARGNMLFRLGSILVNINSNNIEGTIGAAVRRVETRSIGGLNTDYQKNLLKFHVEVYKKSGYDLTRMTSLESDKKTLGEHFTGSQGEGTVRKIGRFYEDKVFGLTQGLPDVVAASLAGSDRANLVSTRMAYAEGLKGAEAKKRALEIFKDASLIEPQTKEGMQVKAEAVADAERSTNTDKRFLAEKSLQMRNLMNLGDLKLGDMNVPFVKTTANSIQSALQTAGVTLPIEVPIRLVKMIKLVSESGGGEGFQGFKQNAGKKSAWGEASKEAFSGFADTVIRAGIGITAGWLLANAIKKEDYIGVYPTTEKERELLRLKNATPNSIRIGNRWYSLDWFGALAAPLIGHLNAKKYGTDFPSYVYNYITGASYQVLRTPGIDYISQSIASLTKILTSSSTSTYKETSADIGNYFIDYFSSRSFPQFIADIALLTDNVVRDTNRRDDILAPLKAKIPGWRNLLPAAQTALGDTTPTEGWRALLFGSRVKTDQSTAVIKELDRLSQSGNLPSITNVEKTSPRAKDLKEQIGKDKFNEAMDDFTNKFKAKLEKMIVSPSYQKLPDEKKAIEINKAKSDLFDATLRKYHYKKPKK